MRRPLLNESRACQVCHPYAEEEIRARESIDFARQGERAARAVAPAPAPPR